VSLALRCSRRTSSLRRYPRHPARWAFDQGAEKNDAALIKLGSQLANDSRQNLLAAYELATREAAARKAAGKTGDPLAAFMQPENGGQR
jgi:hypothetical protein